MEIRFVLFRCSVWKYVSFTGKVFVGPHEKDTIAAYRNPICTQGLQGYSVSRQDFFGCLRLDDVFFNRIEKETNRTWNIYC